MATKIPEFRTRGAINEPGGGTGGFRGALGGDNQSKSIAMQKMSRAFADVADGFLSIQDIQDKAEVSNLALEARKQSSELSKRLNTYNKEAGDTADGSDIPQRTDAGFKELRGNILSNASNSRVARALNQRLDSLEGEFADNAINIMFKRKSMFINQQSDELSNKYANEIQFTAGVGNKLKLAAESNAQLFNVLSGLEDADQRLKVQKVHEARVREAMVNSAVFEEDSAEGYIEGIKGKSKNKELNDLFSRGSAEENARYVRQLMTVANKRDSERLSRYKDVKLNFQALAEQGLDISTNDLNSAKGLIYSNKKLTDREKVKEVNELNMIYKVGQQMKSMKTAHSSVMAKFDVEKFAPITKDNAYTATKYRKFIQQALAKNLEARTKDPVGYVNKLDDVREAKTKAFNSDGELNPEGFKQYLATQKGWLDTLGMSTNNVVDKETASGFVTQIMTQPDVGTRAATLSAIINQYGEDAPAAMTQIRNSIKSEGEQKTFRHVMMVSHFRNQTPLLDIVTNDFYADKKTFLDNNPKITKETLNNGESKIAEYINNSEFGVIYGTNTSGQNFLNDLREFGEIYQRQQLHKGVDVDQSVKNFKRLVSDSFNFAAGGRTIVPLPRTKPNGEAYNVQAFNSFLTTDGAEVKQGFYKMSPEFLKAYNNGQISQSLQIVESSSEVGKEGRILKKVREPNNAQEAWDVLVQKYGKRVLDENGNGLRKVVSINGKTYRLFTQDGNEDIKTFQQIEEEYGR